ncbi:MAG TPA: GGDEF domain-containing protein [Mycobacteriales bacterium]|nr:GGDEF domain-containing protein [Mycobacteriales bacterium]
MTRHIPWLGARWRLVVTAAAALGAGVFVIAVAFLGLDGVSHPVGMGIGVLATVAVNRIYVVVARRGGVLEGIDIAEIAIVGLALALPPSEALVAFGVGSLAVELTVDRALVKKVFNVAVRTMSGGVVVGVVAVFASGSGDQQAAHYVAAAAGGLAYSLLNAIWLAAVVSAVESVPFLSVLRNGSGTRLAVAVASILTGLTAGRLAQHAPLALAGMASLLGLLALVVQVARRAQRERDRLRSVLEATSRIQSASDPDEQESALVTAARELLLWRDVEVRCSPPRGSELGSPLYVREGVDRWLIARPLVDSDPWSRDDVAIVESLAANASAALERAHLQRELGRLALIDPLTGLANRRHLDDALSALLTTESAQPFALLVLDLVDFKSVNDAHGHAAGDDVLRITAERLHACVRGGDLVARLGGDEFVALLPGVTSRKTVRAIIDTIHARVAQPLTIGDEEVNVSVSVGYALAPVDGTTVLELLRAADRGMYDDKAQQHSGREHGVMLPEPRGDSLTRLHHVEA